jgi:hypothetical protein
MAETKAKGAFDQMLQNLMFQTQSQEDTTNWGRRNTVGDTNVGANNAWMQNALAAYMNLVGQKAPGGTLPANGQLPWAV